MFWVHYKSVEPKVQHVLCHYYAAIKIVIRSSTSSYFFLTVVNAKMWGFNNVSVLTLGILKCRKDKK